MATLYLRSTGSAVVTGTAAVHLLSTTQGSSTNATTSIKNAKNTGTWQFIPGTASNTTAYTPSTTPNSKGWIYDGQGAGSYAAGTWTVQLAELDSSATGTRTLNARLWAVTASTTTVTSVSVVGNGSATSGTPATTAANQTVSITGSAFTLDVNQYLYLEVWSQFTAIGSSTTAVETLNQDSTGTTVSSVTTPTFTAATTTTKTLGAGATLKATATQTAGPSVPVSYVNSGVFTAHTVSGSSVSLTLGWTPSIGNYLVVLTASGQTLAAHSGWSLVDNDPLDVNGNAAQFQSAYHLVAGGDTTTITPYTASTTGDAGYAVYELSGGVYPFAAFTLAETLSTGHSISGPTPANGNTLAISVSTDGAQTAAQTVTAPSAPWTGALSITSMTDGVTPAIATVYQSTPTSGSALSGTWTWSAAGNASHTGLIAGLTCNIGAGATLAAIPGTTTSKTATAGATLKATVSTTVPYVVQRQDNGVPVTASTNNNVGTVLDVAPRLGNTIVAFLALNQGVNSVTPPTGFTLLDSHLASGQTIQMAVYTAKVTAGFSATQTWIVNPTVTGFAIIHLVEVSGGVTSCVGQAYANAAAGSTTLNFPSVTPPYAGCLPLLFLGTGAGTSISSWASGSGVVGGTDGLGDYGAQGPASSTSAVAPTVTSAATPYSGGMYTLLMGGGLPAGATLQATATAVQSAGATLRKTLTAALGAGATLKATSTASVPAGSTLRATGTKTLAGASTLQASATRTLAATATLQASTVAAFSAAATLTTLPFPTLIRTSVLISASTSSITAGFTVAPLQNDLLVAWVGLFNSSGSTQTITPPAGWTALGTGVYSATNAAQAQLYYKWASASEPVSPSGYAFSLSGTSSDWIVTIQVYRGVNLTTPFDTYAYSTSGGGTTVAAPTVVPSDLSRYPVSYASTANNRVITPGAGWFVDLTFPNGHDGGMLHGPITTDTSTAVGGSFGFPTAVSHVSLATVLLVPATVGYAELQSSAGATLAKTTTKTSTAGADLQATGTATRTSGATLTATASKTLGAGANLAIGASQTLGAGATLKTTVTKALTAGALLAVVAAQTLGAGATLRATGTATSGAGATLKATTTKVFSAGAALSKSTTTALNAGSSLSAGAAQTRLAGATLRVTSSRTLAAAATLKATVAQTLPAGATLQTLTTKTSGAASTLRAIGTATPPAAATLVAIGVKTVGAGATLAKSASLTLPGGATFKATGSGGLAGGASLRAGGQTNRSAGASLRATASTSTGAAATLAKIATASANAGAALRATGTQTVGAGAYLVSIGSSGKGAGATLQKTTAQAFTAGAYLVVVAQSTATAGASLRATQSLGIAAGATLRSTTAGTRPAGATLAAPGSASRGAAATLSAGASRIQSAAATLRATTASALNAGAALRATTGSVLAAGASLRAVSSRVLNAGAILAQSLGQTVAAGATLRAAGTAGLTAGAYLITTPQADLPAGASLRASATAALAAGAALVWPGSSTAGAGASLRAGGAQSLNAGASLRRVIAVGVDAGATLQRSDTPGLNAGSTLRAGGTGTLGAGAQLAHPGTAIIPAGATLRLTTASSLNAGATLAGSTSDRFSAGAGATLRATSIATLGAAAGLRAGAASPLDAGAYLVVHGAATRAAAASLRAAGSQSVGAAATLAGVQGGTRTLPGAASLRAGGGTTLGAGANLASNRTSSGTLAGSGTVRLAKTVIKAQSIVGSGTRELVRTVHKTLTIVSTGTARVQRLGLLHRTLARAGVPSVFTGNATYLPLFHHSAGVPSLCKTVNQRAIAHGSGTCMLTKTITKVLIGSGRASLGLNLVPVSAGNAPPQLIAGTSKTPHSVQYQATLRAGTIAEIARQLTVERPMGRPGIVRADVQLYVTPGHSETLAFTINQGELGTLADLYRLYKTKDVSFSWYVGLSMDNQLLRVEFPPQTLELLLLQVDAWLEEQLTLDIVVPIVVHTDTFTDYSEQGFNLGSPDKEYN